MKSEIEEWRNICAEKDVMIRNIWHKVFEGMHGIDKIVNFEEDIHVREYEEGFPVEIKKIKNFIQHNKKKLKYKVKGSKSRDFSSKGGLKRVSDMISEEDVEFIWAKDFS